MVQADSQDIFRELFRSNISLQDRYLDEPGRAVDVIIPVINTNPLWENNLYSFYREIPISRLLVGDAGCTDDTIEIAQRFPRVEIIDQSERVSLGYCLRELIEAVQTEWFIYLHADVYLPERWFDTMVSYQSHFDWFECNRRKTILVDYPDVWQDSAERAYSGSQMGRKAAFELFLSRIDDDFLLRNEDIILQEMLESTGGRYGRVAETYHHHQMMNKPGSMEPDFVRVELTRAKDVEWERKVRNMQARGIIKYTQPHRKHLINIVQNSVSSLQRTRALDPQEFRDWTANTNPAWLPYVRRATGRYRMIRQELRSIARSFVHIAKILVAADSGDEDQSYE
jgi:glycosyltransferase involved in cell wall biosynthesis